MKVSLKLPLFGMNMEQATIVKWLRQPGETFNKAIRSRSRDRRCVEWSSCNATLLEILAPPEAIMTVGDIVCHIDS
jgi:hypothetical protein